MLTVGDQAPTFSLPSSDMEMRSMDDYAGKRILLYFYPKDDTPGCTVQANDFTDLLDDFEALGVVVLGVSGDDCFSHQAFRDKYGLKVTLLADVDGDVREAYGVMQMKEKNGVSKMGVVRSTFVINTDRTLDYVEYGVVAKGYAAKMLKLLQG